MYTAVDRKYGPTTVQDSNESMSMLPYSSLHIFAQEENERH